MSSEPQHLAAEIGPPFYPVYFDAEFRPNRSLPPHMFGFLMAALAIISFAAGVFFMQLGAWPITGFFGLDLLLFYGAFRMNYRAGKLRERVRLDARDLVVRRQTVKGEVYAWRFEPTWARVEDDEQIRAISLRSHGRRLILGRFLNEEERAEVAQKLNDALAAWSRDPLRHDYDLSEPGCV